MKAGDAKTFDLRFPDDYHGKEVAGKTATFDVSVSSEVAAPKLPEVDAEFAKALGVADGDLDKMRAEVKANLEREVKSRAEGARQGPGDAGAARRDARSRCRSRWSSSKSSACSSRRGRISTARGMKVKDDMPLPREMFEAAGAAPRVRWA